MQEYNSYQAKYLAKSNTEKEEKKVKVDAKFNYKTKSFELKRFDYLCLLKQVTGNLLVNTRPGDGYANKFCTDEFS
jgi:hypothetical protein